MDASIMDIITKMIGTAAVIVVSGALAVNNHRLRKYRDLSDHDSDNRYMNILMMGLIGGLFGIYGNLSGITYHGTLMSVRDIGPMMSGFLGGPAAGLISGLIAGAHRLIIGGISAKACIIATCLIGVLCGLMSMKGIKRLLKPWVAFLTGALMEAMHLTILLVMVKPFSLALSIVKDVAFLFILVNSIGFTLMITVINYIDDQRKVNDERSRLRSELEVAEKIQRSMLPSIDATFPGIAEVSVSTSMEPAKEVGGDFFDMFFIDPERLAFLIADVSGKGIPAALFMTDAKQTLHNFMMEKESLAEAVTAANEKLCSNNEAEMFVTAWIGVMNINNGLVEFVNAGHNPPLLYHDGKAEYITNRGGLVLAGMDGIKYKQSTLVMEDSDKLLLYTDGVTEAENEKKEQFGEEALLEWIKENGDLESSNIVDALKERIAEHADGYEQSDDITMMCIKRCDHEPELMQI